MERDDTAADDQGLIDYAGQVRAALLGVVRNVLARAATEGVPGEHAFYLTFATKEPGVELAPRLRQQFPEEMTIVLQHQFWKLSVDDAGFSVTLRFAGSPERVAVPWHAVRAFVDPAVRFGLQFPAGSGDAASAGSKSAEHESPPGPTGAETPVVRGGAKIVDFGSFRRRDP